MSKNKIKVVLKQLTFASVKKVQAFISFANFLKVVLLLTKKTKNQDKPFAQNKKAQKSFNILKKKFTKVLILAMYNLEQDTILKTNALDKAVKRYISQKNNNKLLHLIAYYLQKLITAKLNYNVYNKELLAIVNIMQY